MCGIAGLFAPGGMDRDTLRASALAMAAALSHRGPDGRAAWLDETVPLALAHARLSILDPSPAGAQPMISRSGRYVLSFNGEIYNFEALRDRLAAHGETFTSGSDTEILLATLEHDGPEAALAALDGMFAFALWDRHGQRLYLARDRFGEKPLYVGRAGDGWLFASELKAFRACDIFTPELDRDAVALFMRFGYLCAPFSIYRDVWQVLPGTYLALDLDRLPPGADLARLMTPYWSLRAAAEQGRGDLFEDERQAADRLEALLARAVKTRMVADVPLGAFLSGGIDSSLIVAMMQKQSSRPVRSFSIGFEETGHDESAAAAAVAAHLGTAHEVFRVSGSDALGLVPKLADIYDEPFADPSQIPTHLLAAQARAHVTVALTGDGGDELFGGYQRHTHLPALWKRIGWLPASARARLAVLATRVPQLLYDRAMPGYPQFGRRMHRLAQLAGTADEMTMRARALESWHAPGLVPGAGMPRVPLDDPDFWPGGLSLGEALVYADILSYRPNDLCVKTDRATMAAGLEARSPFMDHGLCEFSWRLPPDMKMRGLTGKWLLRRVLARHVPETLTARPKSGFTVPLRAWLSGPLRGWADDMLSPARLRRQGIFDPAPILARWADFKSSGSGGGHANDTDLWTALIFQSWHERWMG